MAGLDVMTRGRLTWMPFVALFECQLASLRTKPLNRSGLYVCRESLATSTRVGPREDRKSGGSKGIAHTLPKTELNESHCWSMVSESRFALVHFASWACVPAGVELRHVFFVRAGLDLNLRKDFSLFEIFFFVLQPPLLLQRIYPT